MVSFEEWEPNTEETVNEQDSVDCLFGVFDEDKFMEYLKNKEEKCPPYSIPSLTKHCKGHQPGTITLITAPSGCGKTMFCVQEMLTDINNGYDVVYSSFENSQMMIYDSIYQACGNNMKETKRVCEHVHYIEWYTFLNSGSKINYYNKHNIKSVYIDYIAGDLFISGDGYQSQAEMLAFLRRLHKQVEEHKIYACVFAQQLPCDDNTDLYDGNYIQSCKSLHQPVDTYISIRKIPANKNLSNFAIEPNRRIQVIKNRLGTRRNCFNIYVLFNLANKTFMEVGNPQYYGGEDVSE